MSGGGVSYKLSEFAKSLPEVEFKFYCEKIEELKCNDPLVIDLHLFKSGSDLKKLIPPITRDHLIVYLIVERRGSDGEKVEAVNNFLASEQYLTNTFSDQLLAFPLNSISGKLFAKSDSLYDTRLPLIIKLHHFLLFQISKHCKLH